MSVRRLAEDTLQPQGFAFDRARAAEAKTWIGKYPKGRQQSAVIPLLMLAQEQEGWVTKASIEHIAAMLDMPLIRVMEVATFYTQFQLQPVGTKAHVQVCGTTPCMLRGAEALMDVCRDKINDQQFHRNDAGTLSWEEVECQGACVNAPMVMIGRDTYEDLTPERLAEIIDAFEAGKGDDIAPGPQIDRVYSAPAAGLTTLIDEAERPVKKRSKASESTQKTLAKPPATKKSASPTAAIAATASAVRPKTKAPAKTVDSGNPTMKLAATASGRAKKPPKRSEQTGGESPAASAAATAKSASEPTRSETQSTRKKRGARGAPPAGRGAASAEAIKPASESPTEGSGNTDRNRPAAIAKPGTPDDLKLISGVGPKLEGTLNDLGIYTFDQIAQWKKAERDWVDTYLKFKGRIDRDDWVKQAKALAKGGVEEYNRVFGKKPK